jgi:hypothetical protein
MRGVSSGETPFADMCLIRAREQRAKCRAALKELRRVARITDRGLRSIGYFARARLMSCGMTKAP